ncbi:MAG: hypothetical protein ACPG4A_03905, partial [Pseudomonadales bacterium]
DYEQAKIYYAEALANKMDFQKVYYKYIQTLLWNDDFNEALADLKMIVFDNPADYTLARQSERHKTLIDQLTASMPQ